MARKIRFIKINHNYFEYQKETITREAISRWFRYAYNDIYDAYDKPSWAKQNIWEAWFSFFSDFKNARIAVSSRNSFTFSIIAETEHFFFYITAMHKRVWLKDEYGMSFDLDVDGIMSPRQFIEH